MFSQQELAPREDQGVVFGVVQAPPNSSIEQTAYYTSATQAAFKALPEYQTSF